jgi:nitrogenase molybdenum-iron protein alpha/beta subunit
MIFGTSAYALFAAASLKRYLDAEILAIGTRNDIQNTPFPAEKVTDLCRVHEMVDEQPPDLLIGSSFEQSVCPSSAFVGLTPPLRGRVRLHAEPLAGIEGMLAFMESVLNACMDRSG